MVVSASTGGHKARYGNAVRLAGELKAVNAIPSLIRVLPKSSYRSSMIVGFADGYHLTNDAVGQALCEIGDPAIFSFMVKERPGRAPLVFYGTWIPPRRAKHEVQT